MNTLSFVPHTERPFVGVPSPGHSYDMARLYVATSIVPLFQIHHETPLLDQTYSDA